MNKALKSVFYCATSAGNWGKGFTVAEAKRNAKVPERLLKGIEYYVMAAIFDNPNEAALITLFSCITANGFFGSPVYADDSTPEEQELIKRLHIGWVMCEDNRKDVERLTSDKALKALKDAKGHLLNWNEKG